MFDSLTQPLQVEDKGITYPPLTVANDPFIDEKLRDELTKRTLGINALPVIYPIMATQTLNSQIAVSFRSSLQKKLWKFLIPEADAEEFLIKTNKDFTDDPNDSSSYGFFLNPYANTSLFISECINLDMTLVNGMIKLSEKQGAYKDRYTSVSYGNYVISHFDKNLLRENEDTDDWSILQSVTYLI